MQTVVVCHGLLDIGDADGLLLRAQQVAQGFLGELGGDGAPGEVGAGRQRIERTLQIAHVAAHLLGQQEGHVVGNLRAALMGLGQHDRRTRLEVRRVDRHAQAPRQSRLQARFQALHLARVAVAGQDDLLAAVEQRIEGVEELFLRAVLAGEELDVVDQQRVHLLEAALELVHRLFDQRLGHGAEELLAAQVKHAGVRVLPAHLVAGGEHQVRLAQAGAAVQQQRVVRTVAGFLRGLPRRGAAQLVAATLDEVVEGVVQVHVAGERLRRCGRARACRGRGAGRRLRRPAARPDFEGHVIVAGEVIQQLADAAQVALAHLFDDERVGCVQHHRVAALLGLQRLQPSVYILGRQFGFQAFEATGPGIHQVEQLASGGGTGASRIAGGSAGRNPWGRPDYHRRRDPPTILCIRCG